MHILTVLYDQPQDPTAFDEHYEAVHTPLVHKIPGLRGFTARRCAPLGKSPSPYYLIAELAFDSGEALAAGMGSPEGQAAADDVPHFAGAGVTMMVAHD